ncbi:MAG: hypothetical protein GX651_06515 [Methanomicrobiales archaeon]|nr:hypothetical protein [Methanomicrobiales archaeon]
MTDNVSNTMEDKDGSSPAPAINETQEENTVPGSLKNVPRNAELEWARQHVPDDPASLFVERKTELIGWGVPAHKRANHLTAEVMVEKIVIPVIERMQRRMLAKIEALDARVDALEQEHRARRERKRRSADKPGDA